MQDNINNKVATLAFVAAGFLAALVVQILFENLAVSFGAVARMHSNETLRHGLPVAVGLIVFMVTQFSPKIRLWADESISEVRKVVWPTRKEVMAMAMVCCVMVVIVGMLLGVFDLAASKFVKAIVNANVFH